MRSRVVVLVLLAMAAAASAQVRPARAPAPLTGTATLTGVVVSDDADARPIRRVAVTLNAPGDPRRQWVTSTDDSGRFAFAGLPAGSFSLVAAKPGFVRAHFGARRPGSTVGVPIAVADGSAVANVTLKMARGAVITGTIFDERGRPMPGVSVRARRIVRGPDGTRTLGASVPGIAATSTSDDRGVYRIYGLSPDDYVVSAEPVLVRAGLAAGTDGIEVRAPTDAELQWAERQVQSTALAPAAQAAAPAASRPMAYAAVFYPNAVDPTAATILTMAAGQERGGIDLSVRFVPTARINGVVLDRSGQPAANLIVTLTPRAAVINETERQGLVAAGLLAIDPTARTAVDGTFTLRGVQPGQYTVMARGLEKSTPIVQTFAMSDVDVNGRDIEGVTLNLVVTLTLAGRVAYESGATPPTPIRSVGIRLTPVPGGSAVMGSIPGPQTTSEFTVSGLLPGRYRLLVTFVGPTVGATLPWALKSATLGGRDIADVPFDIRPGEDLSNVVLTFSEALASVSGVVYDSAGRPSSDLSLLVFSADRSQWFQNSRRLRAPVRAGTDGRFMFTGLPAGEYFLAAVNDFEPNGWFSAEFLDQLIAGAIKVTVADGEKKVQDIRISR